MQKKTLMKKGDIKAVENIVIRENKFITNLFSMLPLPKSALKEDERNDTVKQKQSRKLTITASKSRARSLTELQDRLKLLQSKKRGNYKDRIEKKKIKTKLMKKSKRGERNQKQKLLRVQKLTEAKVKPEKTEEKKEEPEPVKQIFNQEDKIVFSKFDFSDIGQKRKKKNNKIEKDPKKILENLKKDKAKLVEMEQKGEKDKAAKIREKNLWKNAIARSCGEKVKDDPMLLKKTIKKKEQLRKASQKKWKERVEDVKKAQEKRQIKRTENINKRKRERKTKKLKQVAKKGKFIPGFS